MSALPTIGRIVLFHATSTQTLPAIVTGCPDETSIDLEVFGIVTTPKLGADQAEVDGMIDDRHQTNVTEGTTRGTWSWPKREG